MRDREAEGEYGIEGHMEISFEVYLYVLARISLCRFPDKYFCKMHKVRSSLGEYCWFLAFPLQFVLEDLHVFRLSDVFEC